VLGRRVRGDVGVAAEAGGRGDGDQATPALAAHLGVPGAQGEERPGEVGADHLVPQVEVGAVERRTASSTCVGDHDVDRAGLAVELGDLRFIGHVGDDGPRSGEHGDHGLEGFAPSAAHDDLGPGGMEAARHRGTQPGAASGDEDASTGERHARIVSCVRCASR